MRNYSVAATIAGVVAANTAMVLVIIGVTTAPAAPSLPGSVTVGVNSASWSGTTGASNPPTEDPGATTPPPDDPAPSTSPPVATSTAPAPTTAAPETPAVVVPPPVPEVVVVPPAPDDLDDDTDDLDDDTDDE